jgi:predicted rRNA pseudouridine synthase
MKNMVINDLNGHVVKDQDKLMDIKKKINNGFIIVDKPTNISSHELSSYIGKWLNVKAGHSGTLDPNVSGVLIVGLGKATRLLRFLTEQQKTYVCLMRTDKELSEEQIRALFKRYETKIWQTPPEKSAVAKKPRLRQIYKLELLELKKDLVLFKAVVEKGTYIRVLCKQLNGQMLDLRRINAAGIDEEQCVVMQKIYKAIKDYNKGSIEELDKIIKTPSEIFMMSSIQKIYVNKKAAENIKKGAPLYAPGILRDKTKEIKKGIAAIFFYQDLISLMEVVDDKIKEKGLVAKPERVVN